MMSDDFHLETKIAQALGWIDESTRAVIPAIHPATTYVRDPAGSNQDGFIYSRDNNPGYGQVEQTLAALEGGQDAMVLSAGMAAAVLPFMSLQSGDHVIIQDVLYWGVRGWVTKHCARFGIDLDFFPANDPDQISRLLRPGKTKMLWIESPANPTWEVVDISAMAALAHKAGARLVVDSTAATPMLTQPLALGADLVMHAATKYLNGHSDVLAGALVTADASSEWWQDMRSQRTQMGLVLGPQECWLLLRGMRTLALRVRQCSANAQALAEHLTGHPKLHAVLYPGLPEHPGHDIACQQMQGGFGGMMSIRLHGGFEAAAQTARSTKIFKEATSFGGVESLIEHRAPVEGPGTNVPDDLLRLSLGIEHIDDLIRDLDTALG
jgi:cystathionine gamma-synthase